MAFEQIPKIEKDEFYIDVAFARAGKVKNNDTKKKNLQKIEAIRETILKQFERILNRYPRVDELDPFYQELFRAHVPFVKVKKSLAALLWVVQKVKYFSKVYSGKIKRGNEKDANRIRREFYGRINSLVKQVRSDLRFLEETRRILKGFPVVKTGFNTLCIAGFPNVGKTTLLSQLTGSQAEIAGYAFTTKGINVGFTPAKVQLLDTPGTLNRIEKMNVIEHTAYIAMKHLAHAIIYVFDATGNAASFVDQIILYRRIKKYDVPMIIYVSKLDLVDLPDELQDFDRVSYDELSAMLEKEYGMKDVPKKVKRDKPKRAKRKARRKARK